MKSIMLVIFLFLEFYSRRQMWFHRHEENLRTVSSLYVIGHTHILGKVHVENIQEKITRRTFFSTVL